MKKTYKLTRRQLLRLSALAGTGAVIAACAPAAPSGPSAPEAPAEQQPQQPQPTPAPTVKPVPRDQTIIMGWTVSDFDNTGLTNPFAAGHNHQNFNSALWDPLYYWAAFSDTVYPWLAASEPEYNADFTEVTIKLRDGIEWSDGTPITSKDVVFTVNTWRDNEKLDYHSRVAPYVKEAVAVDDKTVKIIFKQPSPRFVFDVLTVHFDTGRPIVPAHVLEKVDDVTAFRGGLDMPQSGPYKVVSWTSNQKIFDLREDWWAIKTGFQPVPEVKRVIMQRIGDDVGVVAQRIVNNEMDTAVDFRTDTIKSILRQNPKVTTHTGNKEPYGYLDWWPNSLWMNHELEWFSDVRVRRAINRAIDRDKIDEVVYDGAKVSTIFPFPLYPALQKFADSPAVKAVIEKYQPRKFDLEESARLMEEAGYKKNADGLWEKDGKTVPCQISGFPQIHGDIVPVLSEMLRQAGFDTGEGPDFGPEAYNNMAEGRPGLYMFGHGASLRDPFAVFELFNTKPTGNVAGSNNFSRYNNPEFEKLVLEMAKYPSGDPRFDDLAVKALEIYYRDMIDVPIIQWLHRIAYNQTYWVNWPTETNVGEGYNGAFWHWTGPRVIAALKKAG